MADGDALFFGRPRPFAAGHSARAFRFSAACRDVGFGGGLARGAIFFLRGSAKLLPSIVGFCLGHFVPPFPFLREKKV